MKIDRKRVDALMAQKGIFRYKDLAERAGLTQKRLSVILNHGSGRPKTIIKVAKALGVFAPDLSGERRDTLKPYGLPTLEEMQAAHRRETAPLPLQSIPGFLARKVPSNWGDWSIEERRKFWAEPPTEEGLVDRDRVCALEVWVEAWGKSPDSMTYADAVEINAAIASLGRWKQTASSFRFGPYGQRRGWNRVKADVDN